MDISRITRTISILLIIIGSFILSYLLKIGHLPFKEFQFMLFMAINLIIYIMYYIYFDIFFVEKYSVLDISLSVFKANIVGMLTFAAVGFFDRTFMLSRVVLLLHTLFLTISMYLYFYYNRESYNLERNTLIVGSELNSIDTIRKGHKVIGIVDNNLKFPANNIPILGMIKDIRDVIQSYRIKDVIFAFSQKEHSEMFKVIKECIDMDVRFKTIPDLYDYVITNKKVSFGVMDVNINPFSSVSMFSKRLMDIVFGILGSLYFLILYAILSLPIKLGSKGPVLLKQERLTTLNRKFTLIKFRTMYCDAEEKTGPVISKGEKDPRITPVGRFLRKYYLDEIPQFINILLGHMSVVGPRPERPELSEKFIRDINGWNKRIFVKPGLTGLAQINNITGLEPKEKIKQDLYYIKNQSFLLDIKIMFRTFFKILKIR